MKIAILAALAMIAQDILGVLLVDAEARNRAFLAGILDSLGWLCAIATLSISVTTLQGHNLKEKIIVILAVTAANMIGSIIGVKIGKRYIKNDV